MNGQITHDIIEGTLNKHPLRALEDHGILFLTGEACAMGLRSLYDLTPEGKAYVEDFLSVTVPRGSNWNQSSGQVASVMLTRDTARDLLAFIKMQEEGWTLIDDNGDVWTASPDYYGLLSDAYRETYDADFDLDDQPYGEFLIGAARSCLEEMGGGFRQYSGKPKGPAQGTRYVHQMSGRAV